MTHSEVPQLPDRIVVLQHDSAVDFLAVAYPTLRRQESSANIVLAHAQKRAPAEDILTDCRFPTDVDIEIPSSTAAHPASNFWLTVFSHPTKSKPVLDMVLSCLDSSLGKKPIFLWTSAEQNLTPEGLERRMDALTQHLRACVDPERVFSVFGAADVAKSFAKVWSGLTSFQIAPEPLYTAYFAICIPETLTPTISATTVRKATMLDVDAVGRLCQEFAAGSKYPLSTDQAMHEAQTLIQKGQLWVGEHQKEIASLCAVTRSSLHVSAITKVYTTPQSRRQGLAQALVQEVTKRLFACGKHSVVLYVGLENTAKRVYERVGFSEGEIWLELGFVGTHIGHW
ncbi:acyl-CoA N-acyltransferase [Mycena galericulata]|nr:acyl-CoA N-acyltransferase [Mycena galericulata]